MNHIPLEILSSVMEYAGVVAPCRQPLSQYSVVSRKWQAAVERITFCSLQLTASDLDSFHEAVQDTNVIRRGYIQSIRIRCIFPEAPDDRECCEVTRTLDRDADSMVWSNMVTRLFSVLSDISRNFVAQVKKAPPPLSLTFLEAFRGKRTVYRHLMGVPKNCKSARHSSREIEGARAQPGTIELHGSHLLPSLKYVSSFTGHGWGESKYLHPSWISKLVEKLPALQELELYMEDAYDWGCNWRKQLQLDLKSSFSQMRPTSLKSLHLRVWTHELLNEDVPVHQLSTPGQGDHIYDRLLQHLSMFHKLRTLYLTGPLTVSPALFQYCAASTSETIFPNLKEFALEFTPATSDGRWFYLRDDPVFQENLESEDEEEVEGDESIDRLMVYAMTQVGEYEVSAQNKYRSLPNPETFTPFLTSAASVCARMPKIKQFSLKLNTNYMYRKRLDYEFVDRVFELWFMSAGQTFEKFNKLIENPVIPLDGSIIHHNRVYFRTGDYIPDKSVEKSWREVVGTSGKINFLDEACCEYYQPWGWKRMQYTGEELQER